MWTKTSISARASAGAAGTGCGVVDATGPQVTGRYRSRMTVIDRARARVRALLRPSPAQPAAEASLDELAEGDRRWREQLLQLAGRAAPYIGVEIDGALFFFSTQDAKIARRLFVQPDLRKDTIHLRRALAAITDAGLPEVRGMFVDVGAHIGTTTLSAILHHGFASAVALEPAPENFLLLRLNVLANGLEASVRTLEVAASSSEGIAELDVGSPASELHAIVTDGTEGRRTQRIPTTTIDALVRDGVIDPARVGLLWMDVEGHEPDVLDGASTFLERGVPVAMELCPDKLARAGRLEHVPEILGSHYTHVLDLRKPVAHGAQFRPVGEIGQLIEQYAGHCFELLACRIPEA
jgi:FkbM family methyltransferase